MEKQREMFKDGRIGEYERGFLEDLLEAIPNVDSSDDVGNTIEYYDEYGSTLFCVDIVGNDQYIFRFYDNAYPVSEDVMKQIAQIFVSKSNK